MLYVQIQNTNDDLLFRSANSQKNKLFDNQYMNVVRDLCLYSTVLITKKC